MANSINFNYKKQAKFLQMIAEDLGLALEKPVKENGRINQDTIMNKEPLFLKNEIIEEEKCL